PLVTATEWKASPGKRQATRLWTAFRRKALIPECKLVQTFPVDYELAGKLKERYIQIGNAVPPFMAYRLADAIMNPIQRTLREGASRNETFSGHPQFPE
ncbi:unnamed protein product, partial [marine sediment metagenome]